MIDLMLIVYALTSVMLFFGTLNDGDDDVLFKIWFSILWPLILIAFVVEEIYETIMRKFNA